MWCVRPPQVTRPRSRSSTSRPAHERTGRVAEPRRLRPGDLARVASVGLRTRRVRAALSALGIAIGVAAIVAVLGLSSSSQAGLLTEIDKLGTNLLTVTNGQTLFGSTAELPLAAPGMVARIGPVIEVADTGATTANVYRSPLIPSVNTNALEVQAATLNLLPIVGADGCARAATSTRPPRPSPSACSARRPRSCSGSTVSTPANGSGWAGMWFYVTGILTSATLAPEIDSSVLVGFAAARHLPRLRRAPDNVYVRSVTSQTAAVQAVLAATANPEIPERGRRQPAVGGARRPRRRARCAQRTVPRPRRRLASGRRRRGRQHHDHRRARTALRDRPTTCARSNQEATSGRSSSRGDPARTDRRRRRRWLQACWQLRSMPTPRHWATVIPTRRLGRRPRRRIRDRRDRGAAPGAARRAALSDRRAPEPSDR